MTALITENLCRNGHPRTATNTYLRPDGGRGCRVCNAKAVARYKTRHPERLKVARTKNPKVIASYEQRLWSRVERVAGDDGCWCWTGPKTRFGYGKISHRGRDKFVHRMAWELTSGPIPEGMSVCHHCDNPPCINPAHLFLGTALDNAADRDAKGRHVPLRGSRNGTAKLSEPDIIQIHSMHRAGHSYRAIAIVFGVSKATIGLVVRGSTWAHVGERCAA